MAQFWEKDAQVSAPQPYVQSGPVLRDVYTAPNPQQDYENTIKAQAEARAQAEEQRKQTDEARKTEEY